MAARGGEYDPEIHHRRSLRLKDYDYSVGVFYFTICVHNRRRVFGRVSDGQVILSKLGAIVLDEWEHTPQVRAEVEIDAFVVMPNHIHGIIFIHGGNDPSAGPADADGSKQRLERLAKSFSAFLAGFKAAITSRANVLVKARGRTLWQRSGYDHVIRNDRDLQARRQYIEFNPARWEEDEYYPEP